LLTFACLLYEEGKLDDGAANAQLYAHMLRKLVSSEWRSVKPPWGGNCVREEHCHYALEDIGWPASLGEAGGRRWPGTRYWLNSVTVRQPIAWLGDREAETLAEWLHNHPGVQIVARDRSKAYEDAVRQGAPEAIQVADRFHLLQNLAEVLDQVINAHIQELNALNDARRHTPVPQPDGTLAAPVPPPLNPKDAVVQAQQRRARRLATDEQVWALHRQGYAGYAMARQLHLGKSTVFRDLRTSTCPERQGRSDRGRNVLDPYKPSLLSRWNAGCREALESCVKISKAKATRVALPPWLAMRNGGVRPRGCRPGNGSRANPYQPWANLRPHCW
jgi:transposase